MYTSPVFLSNHPKDTESTTTRNSTFYTEEVKNPLFKAVLRLGIMKYIIPHARVKSKLLIKKLAPMCRGERYVSLHLCGKAVFCRTDFLVRRKVQVPDDVCPRECAEHIVGDVYFPPEESLADGVHLPVVVVVPSLAVREECEPEIIAALVAGVVALTSEDVREGVDGE